MDDKPINAGRPKLWTMSFVLICLSNFALYMVFYGAGTTLPIYIERFGGATSIAGFAMATLSLAAVFTRPFAGWALDKYGRRLVLLCGMIIFLLPSVVYIFMVPVTVLIFLRFIQGLGWGVGNTSMWTLASDIIPLERIGEGMGFYSLSLSISMAVAPALFLWVIARYSFEVLFQLIALLIIASAALAQLIKYPQIDKQAPQIKITLFERTALRPSLFMLFLMVAYSSQFSFIALYAIDRGLASAGVYFAALSISSIIARPLSGLVIDRKGRRGYDLVILTGCISLFLSFWILGNLTAQVHLLLGGVFFGIGFGFSQPTSLSECVNQVPAARRGAANATYWTAVDIGMAGGSAGCGFVASAFGYGTMFHLAMIPVAIAMAIYFVRRNAGECNG